jgi:hypothetical protein
LKKAEEYNEAAPENKEWVIFDVSFKLNNDTEDEQLDLHNKFKPIDSKG